MTTEQPTECAACAAALRPNARFCAKCGVSAPVACTGCHGWNLAESLFCEHCGLSLPMSARAALRASGAVERASLDQILPPSVRLFGNPERRQTTILFCDLVGSTRLSGELDPEDLREVLHAFREVSRAVVARHEGFIANYMGDGILVLFAYPQAHEDDPQRAVRAGLELVSAIRAIVVRHGVTLAARVGIATGIAVIGPLVSSDGSIDDMIAGQTINLAARLQSLAAPNAVVISGKTQRLVADSFECVFMGSQQLKGFEKAVPAWSVVRERSDGERVKAASEPPALPLIGREREVAQMSEGWAEALAGNGSLIVVQGEPGLGKSRLVVALRELIAESPHAVLRYLCAPRFQDSALFPVIRQLERTADISPDDTSAHKLDKLEAFLALVGVNEETPEIARILAALLGVPFEGRYAPLIESPEKLKQRTFQALKDTLYATARRAPVLLVIEDLHWADPTTIELFGEILAEIAGRRILAMVTVRTGFGGETPKCARTVNLDLQRLSPEQSESVVAHVASGRHLRAEVVEHIIRKSEGVPLFAEEFTKAALEGSVFEADDRELPQQLADQDIPSTLQDSLAARLDRLSLVKEVALVASAIGRDFTFELLAGMLEASETELRSSLRTLVAADLILLHNEALGIYSFKHALLQEAAYGMMLRSTRQKLHRRAATLLEMAPAGAAVGNFDLLTHHLIEAGEPVRAIPYLEQAARRASSRAAHTEARRYLLRGRELLPAVPAGIDRDQLELRLSAELGLATSAIQGYASPEVEAAYQRSLELSRSLGATAPLFSALRGLCTFYIVRAALETARGLAEECLRLAEASRDPADVIESSTALGYTLVYQGSLVEGITHLNHAITHYRQNNGERLVYPSLQDPAVASLSLQAIATWMAGDIQRADQLQAESLELAERLGQPFNIAYAYSFAALLGNIRAQHQDAAKHAGLARQVAAQHGFAIWQGAATIHESIAVGHSTDPAGAIPVLVHMLGLWHAGGAELSRPLFLWGLAHCQRSLGDAAGALQTLDEALAQSDRTGEGLLRPELHRMRGELFHAQAPQQEGLWKNELRLAVSCAQAQGAKLLELRALTAFCSRASGERTSAELERLAELMKGFRDLGGEAPEFARAEALFR